ncbi:hypothetical protein [Acinetobacter shaoyimingii]|uniref:Uncharacterized protein n=1 Tax=Acinetobacter shaoyimingii TaxID=2715164 RepID=A0A6G8RV08_9GAMM|nr:hypothetical protein [Acinetobacter shaoyimingii]NHB58216.1 hypothetical protein [Acinetobacter shaoyimingii]QIO05553.1 hypothetical protein G8E00_06105 [Acinetobacter shaoyimingii]
MKNLKSNILLSTFISALAMAATASHAAEANKMEQAYKSSNVKSSLISLCKEETGKSGKLTANEVSKYCTCAIESDGKLTNNQKWEIQSSINQKKNPSSLPFVQKQNQDLKACFGSALTTKLEKLTQQAMKDAQAKAAAAQSKK